MVNYYTGNQDFSQPFQITQADGTIYDLTGCTVTWYFKDYSTTPATITNIVGSVTNGPLGLCIFNIPTSFFTTVTTLACQIVIVLGGSNISTDPPFTVQILQGVNS